MLVTVFSDAGLCPALQRASWGGWVKSERGVSRGGGVLLATGILSSTLAEGQALANTIHLGLSERVIEPGDRLIAQCDNTGVERIVAGTPVRSKSRGSKAHRQRRAEVVEVFRRLKADYGLTIEVRHVRGHNGYANKRSAVNTYCDQVCSFFLDRLREELAPGQFAPKGPAQPPYGITT